MARVYLITEEEMNSLVDRLKMESMVQSNNMRPMTDLTPDEKNRLNGVHGAFHYIVVNWAQAVGFKGGRW